LEHSDAINITDFASFKEIRDYVSTNGKIFVFMGDGQHKIKRKAEQMACNKAINLINDFS
jgi:hypothetical protein